MAVSGKQSGPTEAVPHPYMMHMLGRGQWVRQGSMRSDARVSGEYATKGLVGERILSLQIYNVSFTVSSMQTALSAETARAAGQF